MLGSLWYTRFAIPWLWMVPLRRPMAVTMRLWFPRTAPKLLWRAEMVAWAREFNVVAVAGGAGQ